MNPRKHRSNSALREKLRADSFLLYGRIMRALFSHYNHFEEVKNLEKLFVSQDYPSLLVEADSLSERKHSDVTLHFVTNQFSQLIRKYPWDPKLVNTNPELKATEKFLLAERKCSRLNKKFALYDNYRSPNEGLLSKIRSFIRYHIDEAPVLDEIFNNCAFGAGASLGVHGNATNLLRKIAADKWTVSAGAYTYGYWAIMRNPHLRDLLLDSKGLMSCLDWDSAKSHYSKKTRIVSNNKVSFVPKTASTHRAIAVEPLLNGYLQKGTDLFLRKRLKRLGIDLSDQSLNQRMAREGSLSDSDESFVTIDLSSASDNISIGLARSILPAEWFSFLNSIRSHRYELGGKLYTYSKFCSMGNGFCFPLETLIFVACCSASGCGVPGTDFSVYGDDIIVRRKHAETVLRSLRILGFSPNTSKTFISGPFRESCGADWFGGVDVRPYTLDYALDSLENMFKWLNLTRRSPLTAAFFNETWSVVLDQIPHRFRFFRPFKGDPDSGIDSWADQHLTSPHCFFERRSMRWVCKRLMHRPVHDSGLNVCSYRRDSVDMYALLAGSHSENYQVSYPLRRKVRTTISKYISSSATSSWLPNVDIVPSSTS